jgi:LacI family transcriptional regulator
MRRPKYIGVALSLELGYCRQILEGIYEYAAANGPWEFHVESEPTIHAARVLAASHKHCRFDGMILQVWGPEVLKVLTSMSIPVVNVSNKTDINKPPTVVLDDVAIGATAARDLIDRGFRHFAYFASSNAYAAEQIEAGFCGELRKAGFPCRTFMGPTRLFMEPESAKLRQTMIQAVRSLPKPSGVMAASCFCAHDLTLVCRRLDLRIPEDVAIISSTDDELIGGRSLVPLSYVDGRPKQLGFQAASLLARLINGGAPPKRRILIAPAGIVTRRSSDITATENTLVASALRYMRDHAPEGINVGDVLREVPISRRALEMNIRKLLHRSPRQQIQMERVAFAAALLRDTDLSLSQVAKRSGFSRPGNFSTVFKRFREILPRDYRRQSRLQH